MSRISVRYATTLPTRNLMAQFLTPSQCAQACAQCPNYGSCWSCPPFNTNPLDRIARYENALVLAVKILPETSLLAQASHILHAHRIEIQNQVLALERLTGGFALGFAGKCPCCHEQGCTRPQGMPCRHPEQVRPSLEAVGFDVTAITRQLFGLPILWGLQGQMPPYLVLATALFY